MRITKEKFEEAVSDNMLTILMVIFCVAVILSFLPVIFYIFHFTSTISSNNETWGQFGDYLGGTINPILSFLALVAILLTIVLQSRDLKQTRDEMKQSNEALQLQKFETTFFEMLRLLGDIVDDIEMTEEVREYNYNQGLSVYKGTKSVPHKGRVCFKFLRQKLEEVYKDKAASGNFMYVEYPDIIRSAYEDFAKLFEHKIGHYFRTLYRIFKLINESDLEGNLKINKKNYSGIARAMLSSNELALLFYDCFYHKGDKFAKMIIEYSLFENMEFEKLLDMKNHIPL